MVSVHALLNANCKDLNSSDAWCKDDEPCLKQAHHSRIRAQASGAMPCKRHPMTMASSRPSMDQHPHAWFTFTGTSMKRLLLRCSNWVANQMCSARTVAEPCLPASPPKVASNSHPVVNRPTEHVAHTSIAHGARAKAGAESFFLSSVLQWLHLWQSKCEAVVQSRPAGASRAAIMASWRHLIATSAQSERLGTRLASHLPRSISGQGSSCKCWLAHHCMPPR
jgi:hypothetical protein